MYTIILHYVTTFRTCLQTDPCTGATYQELLPRAENPCFQEWEKENVTHSERNDEQGHPPHEYHTLMQVGGQQERNLREELATSGDISNEQYSQLI